MSTALHYNSATAFNHRQTHHSITLGIMLQSLVNTQINQNIVVVNGLETAMSKIDGSNIRVLLPSIFDRWKQHSAIAPSDRKPFNDGRCKFLDLSSF